MQIQLHNIPVRDIINGFEDNKEEGVIGYGGKLDIRPKYQREFIYNDKQQKAVINTVIHDFPLNTMYWIKNDENSYEVLDGQQRILSICNYYNGNFAFDFKYIHNLTEDEREQILNYELMVYICEGTDKEKLGWFEVINIAGEKLTKQELRNAVYAGSWTTDAKRSFSKRECRAYNLAKKYMKGTPIRQDYLETALSWMIHKTGHKNIESYMAEHQHDKTANELWLYFSRVINWVKVTFPNYRKEMKQVPWGKLYNQFGNDNLNPDELEVEITKLMLDDDVSKKPGIYQYILTRKEKFLSIRSFNARQKRQAYEKQNGICPLCTEQFDIDEMEADHITPWSEGGRTTDDNCQMLCKECNRRKGKM